MTDVLKDKMAADIADLATAEEAVHRAHRAFGRLDILINSAGVMSLSPILDAKVADWQHIIQLNLLSLMAMSRVALGHMKAQGGGHILNISSVMGRSIWPGHSAGYSSAKWGVGAERKSLRLTRHVPSIKKPDNWLI